MTSSPLQLRLALAAHGTVVEPSSPKEIKVLDSRCYYIYAMTNGDNILTIGISEHGGSRIKKLMRGHTNARHIKSYIVSMVETMSKQPNQLIYVIIEKASKEMAKEAALKIECELHKRFNLMNIAGIDCSSIEKAQQGLYKQYRASSDYHALSDEYKRQFNDWFECLINNKQCYIVKGNKKVKHNQGDTMEVYVLWKTNNKHLIPMICQVTNNYYIYKDKSQIY